MMTKVGQVYQTLENLAEAGFCCTNQPELSKLTGISVRQLYRITKDLERLGLIRVTPSYNGRGKRSGLIYELLSATGSPKGDSSIGHRESDSNLNDSSIGHRESDSKPINQVTGLRESDSAPINHDDDKKKLSTKLILDALDFLDLNGRLKLAQLPHVTTGLAEQARRYVDHLKATKQWRKGSPGRVYRLIEADAVPTQFEMPAAIVEIPQAKIQLAQYTPEEVAEINQTHPLALTGLIFGEDGKWR